LLKASLSELRVEGAQVRWIDRAAPRPVQVSALADAQLAGLVLGKPAPPATFHAVLSADGSLGEMVIDGSVDANFEAPALRATVAARGVRAGALAPYLPSGVELSTTDGRLNATLDASVSKNPQGGRGAQLVVSNVVWRDGENAPLLAMDSFRVIAPRIDLPGNVIVIDEVTLAGLRAQAELDPDGSTRALGLTLRAPPAPPTETAQAAPVATVAAASPTTSPAQDQNNVARLIVDARRPLLAMSLKTLDLNVSQFSIRDLRQPDAAPLSLEDVRVSNPQPIELGGADAESKPPVHLQVTGKINPIINAFTVTTVASPLASEPTGTIDIAASGIRGSGITELRPDLASTLDGSGLTDGRFKTQLQLNAKLDRHGPRGLDLSKPFQLGFALSGLELRDGSAPTDAPLLAGLEAVQADEVKVDPKNGTVIVKSLEISKPSARAYRDEKGIHAMGLFMPAKKATTESATAPAEPMLASASREASASPPAPAASIATKPAGEVRIDRLTISGLDVRVEDRSVDPPLLVPLNNLDVDVRGLTTRALSEPRIIRFDAIVNADKVPLPAKPKQDERDGGGIIGALGGVAKAASGNGNKPQASELTMEQRELFAQIVASGQLAIYPAPRGRVKTAVNGVELAAFKGLAKDFGVDLETGLFDATADVSFDESGAMHTRAKPMLTDLKMDEQGSGAISKYLGAPLDVVIPALRDTSGTITVPLNFKIEQGKLSTGQVLAAASGAFLPIVGTAVASAPMKAASGVTDMVGLGSLLGAKKAKQGPEPVVITFAPGSTTITPDAQAKLAALLELARRDKNMSLTIHHELGGGDVTVASARANPTLDDAAAMAGQLRARKLELANQRAQLAGRVRAQVAWQPAAQSEGAVEQLRALDRQIAQTEQSLDQLYDLMQPGADRQATRRTRAAGLQIAQDRISQVTSLLQAKDLPNAAERVHAAAAQFNPTEGDEGGRIVVAPVTKGH
jgi:hypothetical protein